MLDQDSNDIEQPLPRLSRPTTEAAAADGQRSEQDTGSQPMQQQPEVNSKPAVQADVSPPVAEPPPTPSVWKTKLLAVQAFVIANYLPIAFAIALTWALAWPYPGKVVLSVMIMGDIHLIQEINIIIVFFISGLTLKTDEMMKALKSWKCLLYGFIAILFLTSMLGFVIRAIPLETQAFNIGLMIFSVVPTTLGIGVALVRTAKGDEATALLLTVGTNMLGVVTMPLLIKFLFINYDTHGLGITVNILNLFLKLLVTIMAPSVIGKTLRELSRPVQRFTTEWKVTLGLFSTTNLAFIIWQTLSGARDALFASPAVDIVAVILLAIGQHLFYLLCNYVIVQFIFRPPIKEAIAVGIMASQKSAPVAVTVISYITSEASTQGLLAIPAITGQLCMIFVGVVIAPFLAKKVAEAAKLKAAVSNAALLPVTSQDLGGAYVPPPDGSTTDAHMVPDAAELAKLDALADLAEIKTAGVGGVEVASPPGVVNLSITAPTPDVRQ